MPKFVFRPERVLKFREAQLKMEKAKIEALRRREENLREAVHLKEQELSRRDPPNDRPDAFTGSGFERP